MEEKENQKVLQVRNDQLKFEKESIMREMEKVRSNYEKRIENLKNEITTLNFKKTEMLNFEVETGRQRAKFEETISLLDEQNLQLNKKVALLEAKNLHKVQYQAVDEEIWRLKYEKSLTEVLEKEKEIKKLKQRVSELEEEFGRREESKAATFEVYENKIRAMSKIATLENKKEDWKEIEMLMEDLKERREEIRQMREEHMKLIEKINKNNDLLNEYEKMKEEGGKQTITLEQQTLLINELKLKLESQANYINKLENPYFLLIIELERLNTERNELIMRLNEMEGQKGEIKGEIHNIFGKLKIEREAFETQLNNLACQNERLIKELSQTKVKEGTFSNENTEIRSLLQIKENEIQTLNRQVFDLENEKIKYASLEQIMKENNYQKEELKSRLDYLSTENISLREDNSKLTQELLKLNKDLSTLEKLNRENEKLINLITEKNTENSALSTELAKIAADNKKIEILQEKERTLILQINSLNEKLNNVPNIDILKEEVRILQAQKNILEDRGIRLLRENDDLRKRLRN